MGFVGVEWIALPLASSKEPKATTRIKEHIEEYVYKSIKPKK